MEKHEEKEIETRQFRFDAKGRKKESDSIDESMKQMRKLVFDKKATVEIRRDALGNKSAVIKHEGNVIYATDRADEVSDFELFLADPQAALEKYRKEIELREAERTIDDELNKQIADEFTESEE